MDQDERWDFIYGFSDCGNKPTYNLRRPALNMGQYDQFISDHVDAAPNSVPRLIRLAPHKVSARIPASGGEVWKEKHGFNDGDLWGDHRDEGRAWVEGYLACEHRPVRLSEVDQYVRLIARHYSDPKRHLDKLANVLEPLLSKSRNNPK